MPASGPPDVGALPPPAGPNPQYLGSTSSPVTPTAARRTNWPLIGGIAAVVVIVLGIGAFFLIRAVVTKAVDTTKAVSVPATLGGLPKSTDPTLSQAAGTLEQAFDSVPKPIARGSAIYGSQQQGKVLILLIVRSNEGNTANEFFAGTAKGSGFTFGSRSRVGNSECATATGQPVTACLRTADNLFVAVLGVGQDAAAVAASVDEAFAPQQ